MVRETHQRGRYFDTKGYPIQPMPWLFTFVWAWLISLFFFISGLVKKKTKKQKHNCILNIQPPKQITIIGKMAFLMQMYKHLHLYTYFGCKTSYDIEALLYEQSKERLLWQVKLNMRSVTPIYIFPFSYDNKTHKVCPVALL